MKKLLVLMLAAVLLAVMAAGALAGPSKSETFIKSMNLSSQTEIKVGSQTVMAGEDPLGEEELNAMLTAKSIETLGDVKILGGFCFYVTSEEFESAAAKTIVIPFAASGAEKLPSSYSVAIAKQELDSEYNYAVFSSVVKASSAKVEIKTENPDTAILTMNFADKYEILDNNNGGIYWVYFMEGGSPSPTPDPDPIVITSADFKAQSAVSSDVKFGYEGASFDVKPGPDGYGTEEEVTASNITTGLPDNTKAISLLTSFSMALYDEENDEYLDGKVSGDVALKFQLDPGVTVPEGASLYALIPVYESVFRSSPLKSAQKSSALAAGDGVKFSAFPAEYDKDTKTVTFTANGIYDEAAVVLAAVTAEETPTPDPEPTPSGSSSSGCSAGFGALALLALAPLMIRRKK